MDMVSHNNKTPKKVPNTCMADWDRPAGPGINLKETIKNKEIKINIFLLVNMEFDILSDINYPPFYIFNIK